MTPCAIVSPSVSGSWCYGFGLFGALMILLFPTNRPDPYRSRRSAHRMRSRMHFDQLGPALQHQNVQSIVVNELCDQLIYWLQYPDTFY